MSNFQPARPPRPTGGPQGVLPGVEVTGGKGKAGGKKEPQGVIWEGPKQPDSRIAMVMFMLLVLGVQALLERSGGGQIALGVCFTLAGGAGCGLWLRAWWTWRRAWRGGRWL